MNTKLLRIDEVLRLTAMRRSSLYRAIAAGKFPHPVRLSQRSRAWKVEEIEAWIAERESAPAAGR